MTLDVYMKVSGTMINVMAEALNYLQMEINFKESTLVERPMEKELTLGEMVKSMMVNGRMDKKKVMESGEEFKVIAILASGSIIKLKDMECIPGSMEIDTKVSGKAVCEWVTELTFLPMETFT